MSPPDAVHGGPSENPRSCNVCGWVLPPHIGGYVGQCPHCLANVLGERMVPLQLSAQMRAAIQAEGLSIQRADALWALLMMLASPRRARG